ncbi:hypothetical protein ACMG4M_05185 [Alcanivorax sp. IL3]|uniref:hypothetical protein n=1 Tax=unclassified Alcanivorax TaxID=2638842 RepID=UPI0039C0A734
MNQINIPALIHNAKRAFGRLIITHDMDKAMLNSGRLLDHYLSEVPVSNTTLRVRAQINQMANEYLKKCERYKAGRKAA